MTILSSDQSGPHLQRPGDPQKSSQIISQFRQKMAEIDRFRGELEAEKRRIDRDKDGVKSRIQSYGVANSAELRKKLDEIRAAQSGDFFQLESSARLLENEINRLQGERSIWEDQIAQSEEVLVKLKADNEVYDQTLTFLRDVSEAARQGIVTKIETFVTKALEKIFGEGLLRFKIDLKVKASVPHAEFLLEDVLTGQPYSVLESFGGGVGDVVSTVLRLALLEMQDPINSGPVVLDEVGKFLSDDRQEKFGEFLREWSDQFGRQIILVTHKPAVLKHAHRIFKVSKDDTQSVVDCVGVDAETTIRTQSIREQYERGVEIKTVHRSEVEKAQSPSSAMPEVVSGGHLGEETEKA